MNPPEKICPTCAAPLPPDAPQGLCAQCLLKSALADSTGAPTAILNAERKPGNTAAAIPAVLPRIHYFGDYELIDEIARGGMGVVYRARQVSLNRVVAVKMILSGQFAGEAEVKRFRVEAEAAANLQHPNIVAIHEIGEHEGRHYFSMDFIEGKNLADHVAVTPLSARETATLVKQLAEAVHYAHQRGTLHRDLKPQNVLIDAQGQPHITDFGLAKRWDTSALQGAEVGAAAAAQKAEDGGQKSEIRGRKPDAGGQSSDHGGRTTDQDENRSDISSPANSELRSPTSAAEGGLTHTGAIMGSPSYMAPEQAAGRAGEIGPATDVYSLGAIFYQLLTGQPPHRGASALETLAKVIDEEPTAPRKLKPDVPADLEVICLKCLEKSPERRYATARQLAEELGRFLNGEPILAKPAGASRKVWTWALRHPWAITGSASLVIFGLGFSTYGLWQQTQYLAWLAAHPGQIPFNYWGTLMNRELPGAVLLGFLALIFSALVCVWDISRRRKVGRRIEGTRLGVYMVNAFSFFLCSLYVTAKIVRICVWTDASPVILAAFTLLLQPYLWLALQLLWQCQRSLQQSQTGIEPPPDFLTLQPLLNFTPPQARGREMAMRTLGLVGPLMAVLLVLSLLSLWLATFAKPLWVGCAFIIVILVHCLAGMINPRWIVRRSSLKRSTLNGVRFGYAGAAVPIGGMYALFNSVSQSPGLAEAFIPGLIAGIFVVLWRSRIVRRESDAEMHSATPYSR